MRRFTLPALVAALAATTLAATTLVSPAAHASTGAGARTAKTSCNPAKYKTHTKIITATKAPAITHLTTDAFAPGYKRTTKRTAHKQLVLAASVSYKSGAHVEVGLPGKILGQAGAKTSLSLAGNGKRTTSKSVVVSDYISNPTKRNAQFVFFRGQTKAYGTFRKYYCRTHYLPGQNYGPSYVTSVDGRWKSYAITGSGAIRCGAGTKNLGALARAALKLGCSA